MDAISTALNEISLSNPTSLSDRCWLLDLPPEIREKIYIYIVSSEQSTIILNSTIPGSSPEQDPPGHPSFPLNLLLTTSQIYQEVRPLYFAHNAFSIYIRRRASNEELAHFLSPSFLDNRRQIHTLQVTLYRWGSRNFFTEVLGPAIEDCILNGRLRNLEIRVNRRWIECDERIVRESPNFLMLKKLLKDPYLGRGVLMAGDLWQYWNGSDYVDNEPLEDVSLKLGESYLEDHRKNITIRGTR